MVWYLADVVIPRKNVVVVQVFSNLYHKITKTHYFQGKKYAFYIKIPENYRKIQSKMNRTDLLGRKTNEMVQK